MWKRDIIKLVEEPIIKHIHELRRGGKRLRSQFKIEFPDAFTPGEHVFPVLTYSEDAKKMVKIADVAMYVGDDGIVKPENISIYQLDVTDVGESIELYREPPGDKVFGKVSGIINDLLDVFSKIDWMIFADTVPQYQGEAIYQVNALRTTERVLPNNQKSVVTPSSTGGVSIYKGLDWRKEINNEDKPIVEILERKAPSWWNILLPAAQKELIPKIVQAYRDWRRTHTISDIDEFWQYITDILDRRGYLGNFCKFTAKEIPVDSNGVCAVNNCPRRYTGSDGKCMHQRKGPKN